MRDAARIRRHFGHHGANRDPRRHLGRKRIDAGRDRRKRDRRQPMLCGEIERGAVAGFQQPVFVAVAALPDRPDRLDNVPRLQLEAGCDLGAAGLASTQPATRQRRTGFGDLRLNASYTIPAGRAAIALWNQVKVPTASADKGLGTGELDYSFGAEVAAPIGRVTPFAGIGYTLTGEPEDYDLRNSLSARAGANVRLTESIAGRLSYAYAQSPSAAIGAEQLVSTTLQMSISRSLSLGLYGSAGLSDTAPDFGTGIQLAFRLR